MFCFTKYLSQSPFFKKFLKSEGGAGGREELFPKKFLSPPCYYDSPKRNPFDRQELHDIRDAYLQISVELFSGF